MSNITSARGHSELLTHAGQVTEPLGDAFAVWSDQCEAGQPPAWSPEILLSYPSRLLPWAVVSIYEPESDDFRVRFWGSQRTSLFRRDATNRLISGSMTPVLGEKVLAECLEVRERRQPLIFHSRIETAEHGTYTYRKIRLPLRKPGGDATDVVLSLDDPDLITRQIFKAWDVPPPAHLGTDPNTP